MLVCFGMPTAVWRQCDVCATAKASDAMLLSGVPIPGCRSPLPLGPISAFQEIGLGLLPTSASGGGPLAADLSNCTRRASRQCPAPPGPTRCRGAQGISGCPGPAQRSAGPAARCAAAAAAAAGLQPAKHAAGGLEPTPGRCCGLGPHASPSHRTGDWARVPARTALAGMLVTDPQTRAACGSCMLRYQARQLRWRKRRVAAASSGLVCARPTLLGASFACDFDPRVPDAAQVRRRDAACRKLCQMREFNADICAKPTALAADRRLNSKARSGLRSSKGARVVFSAHALP